MFPTYGFVFIAVLIIASGLIAYLGDVLGRRMGRKRLTLWGLRPRHTAMVMSIVAGVMITVVTLGAAMTVSDKVRDGLTQMDRVRDEIVRLNGERTQLISERDQSRQAVKSARAQLVEVRGELAETRGELSDARADLGRAAADLARTKDTLVSTRGNLATARRELKASQADLAAVRKDLTSTGKELEEARSQVQRRLHELDNAEELLIQTNEQRRVAARERDHALWERDEAIAERDQASAEAAVWKALASKALVTRTKRAIFAPNEAIMSTVIDGRQPPEATRSDLQEFLAAVDERAREAGAAHTETDPSSVIIVKFELDPETGEPRPAAPEKVLDAVASEIHTQGESVLVQAYSVWTGLEGEQTPVDFELYRNRLVFRKGEEIARASFDSSDDQVNHLLQLVGLLQQQVGARARERGVMPVAARWLPGEPVITSPPTVVGDVSLPEVKRILSEIKARRGEIAVVVSAADDTYTAGPLKVSLAAEGGT